MTKKPVIGLTLGDPAGIGPEIVEKALQINDKTQEFTPILFGSKKCIQSMSYYSKEKSYTLDEIPRYDQKPSAENGRISINSIQKAVESAQKGEIDALVTAPINKTSLSLSGSNYTGHTTLLRDLAKSPATSMAFHTHTLKTILATIHIPFTKVVDHLTTKNLETVIKNSYHYATLLGIKQPKIALAGLNPHAGENNLFGSEETNILIPAIEKFSDPENPILGPFPADTLYHRAHEGEFDIVISLYHDQGLIPIKLIDFKTAVNVTLGLPFIRTSPCHGTAFDIAGQNKASADSMISAINLAIKLAKNKVNSH